MAKQAPMLTQELVSKLRLRYKEIVAKALSANPQPADRKAVEEAISRIYVRSGKRSPSEFVWFESEAAASNYIRCGGQNPETGKMWGANDVYWLAKLAVFEELIPGTIGSAKQNFDDLMILLGTWSWWPFEGVAVCCDTPKEVDYAGGKLVYRDGTSISFLPVPKKDMEEISV